MTRPWWSDRRSRPERYEDCVRAGGQRVLLAGERGVGKTTLVGQFRDRVRDREPEPLVVTGTCEPGTRSPYEPFRQAFDSFPPDSRPPGVISILRAVETFPAVLTLLQAWVAFERDRDNAGRVEQLHARARAMLAEAPPSTARHHREWVESPGEGEPERGD